LERELASEDDADAVLRGLLACAHDAIEPVAIGDGDRVVAELGGAEDHVLGRCRAGEEAEVRATGQLDVATRTRLDRSAKREQLVFELFGQRNAGPGDGDARV